VPIRFTVYPLAYLVWYRVVAVPTAAECRAFLDAVRAHERYARGFDFLGEYQAPGPVAVADAVAAVAAAIAPRVSEFGGCRWAVVTPDRAAWQLVNRLLGPAPLGGTPFAAFEYRPDAFDWLTPPADRPAGGGTG
jgi:hypothetical protein